MKDNLDRYLTTVGGVIPSPLSVVTLSHAKSHSNRPEHRSDHSAYFQIRPRRLVILRLGGAFFCASDKRVSGTVTR